jgi:hypothetical protein
MFFLFMGDDYYPEGGVHDLHAKGTHVECRVALDEAKKNLERWRYAWWHIANEEMEIVEKGGSD